MNMETIVTTLIAECAARCEHLVEEIVDVWGDDDEEPTEMLIVFTDGQMARVSVRWVD